MARTRILHTNLDHIWRKFKDLFLPPPSQPDISLAGRRFRPYEEDGAVEMNEQSF